MPPSDMPMPKRIDYWLLALLLVALVAMMSLFANDWAESESRQLKQVSTEASESKLSSEDGYKAGYRVGKYYASQGEKRNGSWAYDNGLRLGGKKYAGGYLMGYNDGWHAWHRTYKK